LIESDKKKNKNVAPGRLDQKLSPPGPRNKFVGPGRSIWPDGPFWGVIQTIIINYLCFIDNRLVAEFFSLLINIKRFRQGKPLTKFIGWIPRRLSFRIIIRSVFDPLGNIRWIAESTRFLQHYLTWWNLPSKISFLVIFNVQMITCYETWNFIRRYHIRHGMKKVRQNNYTR
jgi:hypothetical protein